MIVVGLVWLKLPQQSKTLQQTVALLFIDKIDSRDVIFNLFRSPGIDSKESIPSAYAAWAGIFKRVWGPGIDSKEWIPPAFVAWRAGTITLFLPGS